jgi:hypothetical protein
MALMKTGRFERLARLGVGASVLLAVHFICAPRSAWAGCEHLVGSQFDPFANLHQLDSLIVGGSPSLLTLETPDFPFEGPAPARRTPCTGMSCSMPVSLPVSTASAGSNGPEVWGALGVIVMVESASPRRRAIDEPAFCTAGEQPAIFHPPRA